MYFREFDVGNLESFPQRLQELLDRQKDKLNKMAESDEAGDILCLKKFDDMAEERELFFTPLSHLNSVLNSEETQKAYEESLPILNQFSSFLGQNRSLYLKFKEIKGDTQAQKERLNHIVLDFELEGVALCDEDKKRLQEINIRLSELSNQFQQNLLNATNSFEMIVEDFEDVKELPESDLDSARFEEDGKVKWRFTLQMPSYFAYITYGSNRALREKIYKAYSTKAPENSAVIDEILSLRDERAKLLGFENYAEFALQKRDASTQEKVLDFLWSLVEQSKGEAQKEFEELKRFAKKLDGLKNLESYDIPYYSNKFKNMKFDFDENDTKPYFQTEKVVEGLFNILFELFGMEFRRVQKKSYHPLVQIWDIYHQNNLQARLYLDLEARAEKRGGAWMHNWETHFVDSKETLHLPSAFVVANFPKASENFPSLLNHSDIVTFFHEIGHAIHHIFSKVKVQGVSGVNGVAWDSVEFPSQFLENFAYEEAILRRFAYHYKSLEPMPDELIKKIKDSKNLFWAMNMLRQLEFGLFDFMLHQKLYQGDEVQALLDDVRKRVSVIKPPKYNRFQNGFSHIFAGGYAAGYYSYKWAEVFSADAFFECVGDGGEFKKDKAQAYLENILQKGSSNSMSNLYKDWLGREPKTDSLIRLYTN